MSHRRPLPPTNNPYQQQQQYTVPSSMNGFAPPQNKWALPQKPLIHYNPTGSDGMKTQSHFSNSTMYTNPNYKCPHCFSGKEYFELNNDTTNTVYCGDCRQPYHHCPQHKKPIMGIGYRADSHPANKCQCVSGEAFLDDDQWNSVFRR